MSRDPVLRFRATAVQSRVRVAPDALDALGGFVRQTTAAPRVALVTDARVDALHGDQARRALRRARIDAVTLRVPRGESAKRPEHLARLWERLAAAGIGRTDAIVALGGGVVGDLAGFAAATWLRGVPWVCVPTTVLAQVDSGIGGKTAVDLAAGKNLVGAFHQPAGVLVDPVTLLTLTARERRAGLAEVVKTGMATDAALFRWAESHADSLAAGELAALDVAVRRSIRAKARIVLRDEREAGPRTALNFGHTVGHALEAALHYRGMKHGEAVAVGMRVAAALSVERAGLPERSRARLEHLLESLRLPSRIPGVRAAALESAMRSDKKRSRAGVRWVLTPRVGHASLPRLIPGRLVRRILTEAGARS